jgi:hypothetical protein
VPEVATKLEPAALQAGEVAVLPVPAAPTMKRKRQRKVVEADHYHAGCVTDFSRPTNKSIF